MSDHDELRAAKDACHEAVVMFGNHTPAELVVAAYNYRTAWVALLDERDALAARVATLETAARAVADHHALALAEDAYRDVNPDVIAALDNLARALGDTDGR